jgi:hypothetical protein
MHVNKVHRVTTITRVAEDLGENEDWIRDVANEMEIEDGVVWVYGVGEDGVMAFTDAIYAAERTQKERSSKKRPAPPEAHPKPTHIRYLGRSPADACGRGDEVRLTRHPA